MWTKDYLVAGFGLPGCWQLPWTRQDEWQALYRVEGARRALKAARARAEEERRAKADMQAHWDVQRAASREWHEARRREVDWAQRAKEDLERRRLRLPVWGEWAAWRWACSRLQHRQIGEELGGVHWAMVSAAVRDYLWVSFPDVRMRPGWTEACEMVIDVDPSARRPMLRRHFAGRPEPVFPGRIEAIPTEYHFDGDRVARNRWIYEQRLAGRQYKVIAQAAGISRNRAHQIYESELRRERQRRLFATSASIARARQRTLWPAARRGRPLDMGGPRDVWLEFSLDSPARFYE